MNGDNIEIYVEMFGIWSNSVVDFIDGIVFNEVFIYCISVEMNLFMVILLCEGKVDVVVNYDMSNSFYDVDG